LETTLVEAVKACANEITGEATGGGSVTTLTAFGGTAGTYISACQSNMAAGIEIKQKNREKQSRND